MTCGSCADRPGLWVTQALWPVCIMCVRLCAYVRGWEGDDSNSAPEKHAGFCFKGQGLQLFCSF